MSKDYGSLRNKVNGFIFALLWSHKHDPKINNKPFSITELLEHSGYDPVIWAEYLLGEVWEYYFDFYKNKKHFSAQDAHAQARLTAAHRVGAILKMTMAQYFPNQFVCNGANGIGRFGGKKSYSWVSRS